MRWPLKNQILIRTIVLLLITIGAITFANIRSVISVNSARESSQMEELVELIQSSSFPLTNTVLETMKSLSGAEFVLVDESGEIVAKTDDAPRSVPKVSESDGGGGATAMAKSFEADGSIYFHKIVSTKTRNRSSIVAYIHVLIPRQSQRSIWWTASRTPSLIAVLVLPLAILVSFALAGQVTRPLAQLQKQVREISNGDAKQVPVPSRDDEIRDLNVGINELVIKLQDHDNQLRQNERLRTMVQFGNGIAHHLRNSATGCKMAIELLASNEKRIANSDNYQVAMRQLGLMDNYIRKFLAHSKSPDLKQDEVTEPVDLAEVLDNVEYLLQPSAKHLRVELSVQVADEITRIQMNREDAEQLMMNLIGNAITAASEMSTPRPLHGAQVNVDLSSKSGTIVLQVTDNGAGPPEDIANDIFQPFVTGSPEGTGLGLSLVKEIAHRIGGSVTWVRENELTVFEFQFGKDSKECEII